VLEHVLADPESGSHRLLRDRLGRGVLAQVQQAGDPCDAAVVTSDPRCDRVKVARRREMRLESLLQFRQQATSGVRQNDPRNRRHSDIPDRYPRIGGCVWFVGRLSNSLDRRRPRFRHLPWHARRVDSPVAETRFHRPFTVVRRADQMQVRLALAVPADEVVDQSGRGGENGDCAVLGEQATERLGRSVVREHPRNRRLADLIKFGANLSQIPLGLDTLGELDVLLGDQLGEIPRADLEHLGSGPQLSDARSGAFGAFGRQFPQGLGR
jgi:hypothetical protein